YSLRCVGPSTHGWSISCFGGSSVSTWPLVRRRTNGRTNARSTAADDDDRDGSGDDDDDDDDDDACPSSDDTAGGTDAPAAATGRAPTLSATMARSNRCSNSRRVPSIPALQKSMIDQSSSRRFSTGVPVSARRSRARSRLTACVVAASAFFTFCASSSTTYR